MASRKNLTASNIRYLLTVKELDRDGRGARCTDVALALGLTRPSVHNMMKTLIELGLICKDAYGAARLTVAGEQTAARYGRYFRSVHALLTRGFPESDALTSAACALLSELPEAELEGFCVRAESAGTVTG